MKGGPVTHGAHPGVGRELPFGRLAHWSVVRFHTSMRQNGMLLLLKRIALLVVFLVAAGSRAAAQTPGASGPDLRPTLAPGLTAWITDSSGREEKTRIVGVTRDVVTAAVGDEVRRVNTANIVRVTARRSDSVLDGALIGAGVAIASGLFLCTLTEPWENCRDDVGPTVRIGALGAGIGIGIDALIRGRKTVFEAPRNARGMRAVPLLAVRGGGLLVSMSF
jgi:hypothetical protein